jgi:hypothetical protein
LDAQGVARGLPRGSLVPPFQEVPSCHDEIECGEHVCRVRLYATIVVIELRAKIVSSDEVEETGHRAT